DWRVPRTYRRSPPDRSQRRFSDAAEHRRRGRLCLGPAIDAHAVSGLQFVAGVPYQMAAEAHGSLGDLPVDRGDLHTIRRRPEKRRCRRRIPDRNMERGGPRRPDEALLPRPVRPPLSRLLSSDGLERPRAVSGRECVSSAGGTVARDDRRRVLHNRRGVSSLGAIAVPERDLAFLRASWRKLPLRRGASARPAITFRVIFWEKYFGLRSQRAARP